MKDGIHPKYGDATITCACGNVIHTRSTKPEMQVNSRVDMFKKRYAKFAK